MAHQAGIAADFLPHSQSGKTTADAVQALGIDAANILKTLNHEVETRLSIRLKDFRHRNEAFDLFAPCDGVIELAEVLLQELAIHVIGQRKKVVLILDEALVDLGGDAALFEQLWKTFGNFHERYLS